MYMKKRVKNENLSVLIYLELAPDGFESNARTSAHAAADGIEAGEGQHARVVESEWSWSCWTGKKITGTGTAHQRPYCSSLEPFWEALTSVGIFRATERLEAFT